MPEKDRTIIEISYPQGNGYYVGCDNPCCPPPQETVAAVDDRPFDEAGLVVICPFCKPRRKSFFRIQRPVCTKYTTWISQDLSSE